VSFGEVIRQIKYKAEKAGKIVIVVDRYFPSSKRCRMCGLRKVKLTLGDRIFICDDLNCGHRECRDLNASRNTREEGLLKLITLGRRGIACGDLVESDGVFYVPVRPSVVDAGKPAQSLNTLAS
jgi:putative transposase